MKRSSTEKQWGICLSIVALCTIVLCISALDGIRFSDTARIILGVIEIISIPIMIFFTVRVVKENNNSMRALDDKPDSTDDETEKQDRNDDSL